MWRTLLSGLELPTETKDPFYLGWSHQPGQKGVLISRLVLAPGTKCLEPFVPVGATNRDKRGSFCPGWCLQPGQKAPVPPLAWLAVGPGTKATYCPGPKSSRDKWPGTKAYSVVVAVTTIINWTLLTYEYILKRLKMSFSLCKNCAERKAAIC